MLIGSLLGSSLINAFLIQYEKHWLNGCPQGFKLGVYRRFVDHICVLFRPNDHLKYFQEFRNSCLINMSFSMETERQKKNHLQFEVIGKHGKFTTTVYRNTTFSGVYSNFESCYFLFINLA